MGLIWAKHKLFIGALFFALAIVGALGVANATNIYATASTLSLSIDNNNLSLDIVPSMEGIFNSSASSNVTVSTNNTTGYTLSIKANNSTALVNTADNTLTIPSISTAVSESDFSSNATYNNMWGYKPSKFNSADNTDYLPSPSTTGDVLDATSAANTTANTYTLALGAKIDSTVAPGSYNNAFTIMAIANAIPYAITYNANAGSDTVTGMPSPATVSSSTYAETVTLDSAVPEREGYEFKGWCTAQTADGESCTDVSGTTYNPDGAGTDLTWTLDQTSTTNSLTLYAAWGSSGPVITSCSTPVPGITYMQELADSTKKTTAMNAMATGNQYLLVDERDNKGYCVAKQADGKIWMTRNLDLELTTTGAKNPTTGAITALTSQNTNLTTSGSGAYSSGYTSSGGVITWTPASTAATATRTISGTTVSNWTNSNTAPYSAEGGDTYIYTSDSTSDDTVYSSLSACTDDHAEEDCTHYHVGNYYNWTAAIASNASSSISSRYTVAANSICPAGWRLPRGRASSDTSATRVFGYLFQQAGVTSSLTAADYASGGFNKLRTTPLFFVRGGFVYSGSLYDRASSGYYWSSAVYSSSYAYDAVFSSSGVSSAGSDTRYYGRSVRCVAQ